MRSLYLDRRAEDDAARKRYGLEVFPEDSFFARIRIMSGYREYEAVVGDLYARYMAADERGKALIIAESEDVYVQFNIFRFGPETVEKMADRTNANVGASVFGEGEFQNYGYEIGKEDLVKIEALKTEVEKLKRDFRAVLENPGLSLKNYHHVVRTIGENPDDSHIERMAISACLCNEMAPWHLVKTPLRALLRLVFGGVNSLQNFGKQLDFCADAALVSKILADEIGHRGQITNKHPNGKLMDEGRHQCLVFEDGARIDPFYFGHLSGYLADPANYDKEFNALSFRIQA